MGLKQTTDFNKKLIQTWLFCLAPLTQGRLSRLKSILSSSTYSSLLICSPLSECYVPHSLCPLSKEVDYHRTSLASLCQPHKIWCKRSRMTTRPSFHRLKHETKMWLHVLIGNSLYQQLESYLFLVMHETFHLQVSTINKINLVVCQSLLFLE